MIAHVFNSRGTVASLLAAVLFVGVLGCSDGPTTVPTGGPTTQGEPGEQKKEDDKADKKADELNKKAK